MYDFVDNFNLERRFNWMRCHVTSILRYFLSLRSRHFDTQSVEKRLFATTTNLQLFLFFAQFLICSAYRKDLHHQQCSGTNSTRVTIALKEKVRERERAILWTLQSLFYSMVTDFGNLHFQDCVLAYRVSYAVRRKSQQCFLNIFFAQIWFQVVQVKVILTGNWLLTYEATHFVNDIMMIFLWI